MHYSTILKSAALLSLLLSPVLNLSAQDMVRVEGRVVDEQNQPMITVGVVQKGTSNGVMTDIDGNYSISVPNGSTLEFLSLGYRTEERTVDGDAVINVRLFADILSLDETVVVGYGVQKKSDITGSISQVKSDEISNRTITSPVAALQGKTAGVQILSSSAAPGSSPTVRIRGISSNGSSDPLYVVDGRIASSISGIDPNDIESMEVLKDGASAAIYGAQAGNGVILITTRRGQGEGKINYSCQFTSQRLARVPEVMNAEQYMQYYLEDGRYDLETFYRNWDFKTNTDWVNYAYEPSVMQHHNLSFSSGNERSSIYVSGSYLDNNGMFAGDSDVYRRATGMFNASWNIKPWLDIQTNNQIEYYRSRSVSEGSDYGSAVVSALQLDPLTPTVYSYEQLPSFMLDLLAQGRSLLQDENGDYYAVSLFNSSENINPLIMRDRSYSETNGFNVNGSTALNFKPFKSLVFTSRLGYRLTASDSYGYSHDYYANSNAYQNYVGLSGSDSNSIYYQWENFVNFNRQFGAHNLNAMAGMSYSQSRSNYVSGSYNGSDDDLGVKQDDPLFYYFAYATATANKAVYGAEPAYSRKLSYFGRASWNYMGRYYLGASFRADAADLSILPAPKRWGYFPSVSGAWTISEEPFFREVKSVVPYMKLRASWGQNGSLASLGSYAYANVIASTGSYPTGNGSEYINGYAPSSSGNQDLKWETSEQLNIGVDLRFFRDRLSLSADWYKKTTKDLIVSGITPSTVVGVTASPVNAGNMENRGVELELKWRDSIGDFSYGVSANAATLKNEVTYIHESLRRIAGVGIRNYGTITYFEKGRPAWYFYGYKFSGVNPDNGDAVFEDINGDGVITDADKTCLGSGIPSLTYGLTLNAAWKGFDMVVFATGTHGAKIFNALNVVDYASNKLTYFTEDRWTPTGRGGSMPAANASNWTQFLTSDGVVFSGDYLKIKQIQLGYTLPASLTRKVKVDNLRVYVSLDDFFTFTEYPGFDPEVTGVGSALGVDKGSYPTSRKVVFGVNLTF